MNTTLSNLFTAIGLAATMFLCIPAKAATELANQDAAFSLLIEAFGEVQGGFIENDYHTRLQAAGSITDPVSRWHAFELARQERDLRLGKLKRQLTEMTVAYHYSGQSDERDSGVSGCGKINPAAAARNLRKFVFIGAATDGETNVDPVTAIQRLP
jgi:hypothetical protein